MVIKINICTTAAIICGVYLLSGCVKDNSGNQPLLVQSIAIDSNSCVINFAYDGQNRLTAITQCDTVETFTYNGDSVVDLKVSGGVFTYKNTYMLSTAGIATGYKRIWGDGTISYYVITYNQAEQRVSVIDILHPNNTDILTIQNSNVVQQQYQSSITGVSYNLSSAYYSNTRNTIANANFGLNFLGTSSANLKKADTYAGQYTIDYNYTLNVQNGVARQVSTINGNVVEVRNFMYY